MRQTLKSPQSRPTRRRSAIAVTAVAAAVAAGLTVLAPPASGAVSGQVWTVGLGSDGQLGSGSTSNRTAFGIVNGLTDVAEISGGREHVVTRTNGGQVWAWGDVSKGAVGDGSAMSTAATDRRAPVQVLTGATGIATGHYHSLAVLTDGTVRSWGYNNYGQLGNGTTTGRSTPGAVTGLSGVTAVFGGRDMSYALLTSGSLRAWGNNPNGELGDGTTTRRTTPVAVSGITNAIAVAGGRNHGLALLSNGTIKAWGLNTYGQLGDGTTTNRTTPITVSGITNAVAIGAGAEHSLAVLADGRVLSWGRGYRGALGSGSTSNRLVPGAVNGLPAIASVDAGRDHTLAIAADGRLYTWGFDDYGQLGDGLTANRLTPYQVPGITDAVEAGGGRGYSVILRASGGGNPDITPPTAPGTPTAASTVSGRVDLSWAASTDDRATTLTYRVFRDGGASLAGTVSSSSVGQVTWSDTGRTPGAVHTYTVEASDGTNTSTRSGELCAGDGGRWRGWRHHHPHGLVLHVPQRLLVGGGTDVGHDALRPRRQRAERAGAAERLRGGRLQEPPGGGGARVLGSGVPAREQHGDPRADEAAGREPVRGARVGDHHTLTDRAGGHQRHRLHVDGDAAPDDLDDPQALRHHRHGRGDRALGQRRAGRLVDDLDGLGRHHPGTARRQRPEDRRLQHRRADRQPLTVSR